MNPLIRLIFSQPRAILALFFFAILAGGLAYINLPREADPDIEVPVVQIYVSAPGISARDGERLVGRPIEKQIRGVEGIKNVFVTSLDNYVVVVAEFTITTDSKKALEDLRAKIQQVRSSLPQAAKEPIISETNFSLFPILVVGISGNVPERTLLHHAETLENRFEALSSVLSADIDGKRDEVFDIILKPDALSSYNLSLSEVIGFVSANNQLIAAGLMSNQTGRFSVRAKGLIETVKDIYDTPIKVTPDKVVTLSDVAEVRRSFKRATNFTRLNGEPALALNIVKRRGENVLTTIDDIKAIIAEETALWPDAVKVTTLLDRSTEIVEILSSLENSVLTAIVLVMLVCLFSLGWRPSLLIGVTIPASFAMAYMVLSVLGYTLNVMVLFGMVLTVGMLVDNVIVITEYADRKMSEGKGRREAYGTAASRMLFPVFSSTLTTLAAFLPLLLWPGVSGKFMELIPTMVIIVLSCSYLSAMIAVPLIGALISKQRLTGQSNPDTLAVEDGRDFNLMALPFLMKWYGSFIKQAIRMPFIPVIIIVGSLVAVVLGFWANPTDVEFFVDTEAGKAQVYVSARGNLSNEQKAALVDQVEKEIRALSSVKLTLTKSGSNISGNIVETPAPIDAIGIISLELAPYSERGSIKEVLALIEEVASRVDGVKIEVRKEEQGPPQGRDIQLEVTSTSYDDMIEGVKTLRALLSEADLGLTAIDDNLSRPGISWEVGLNRLDAARFGTSLQEIGGFIRLVTDGYTVGSGYPDDSLEELDVRVLLPKEERSLHKLLDYSITTPKGQVKLSNLIDLKPVQAINRVQRTNGRYSALVSADIKLQFVGKDDEGKDISEKPNKSSVTEKIDSKIAQSGLLESVFIRYRGADEEEKNSQAFVQVAGLYALALMFIILVAQYRSFGQTLLTLTTVVFSVVGVLLGMLVTGQKFSIIMSGVGVVGLAGIVVNNAILLIDTYNSLRQLGLSASDAAVRTSMLRLRPILLTTVTTITGLIPLATQTSIDFENLTLGHGGITSVWWVQLATAMISGMMVSTFLTLIFIPCMLVIGDWVARMVKAFFHLIAMKLFPNRTNR